MDFPFQLVIGLVVAGAMATWVYGDAISRNKTKGDAILWSVGTFLACFPVILVWLVMRPKLPSDAPVAAATPSLCIHCGKYFDGTPSFCPHCGTAVK